MTLRAQSWRRLLMEDAESAPSASTAQCRTKVRGTPITIGPSRYRVDWGFDSTMNQTLANSELIKYECTRKQRTGYCWHEKHTLSCPRTLGNVDYRTAVNSRHWTTGALWGWAAENWLIESRIPPLPAAAYSLSDLDYAAAIAAMKPKIDEDMSALVSLAELGDLKSAITGPLKIARNLVRGRGSLPKRVLRAAGSVILHDKFVNKQTVRDAQGLYTSLMTVQDRLDRLVNNVGKVVVSHYSFPKVRTDYTTPLDTSDRDWTYRITTSCRSTEIANVTMRYTYYLVDAAGNLLTDPSLLKLGAYLDSLGIRANPQILWDLVPFSFVIDYFVKVGDFLESFSSRNINARIAIIDLCASRKLEVQRIYDYTRWVNVSPNGPKGAIVGKLRAVDDYSLYERQRIFPKSEWLHPNHSLELSDPSWGQWVTMFSLVSANLR